MRWATRAGVHIDRAACAWLIRRHIDADAEFVFVTDPEDVSDDCTPFDMRGVELGHHGNDCSFETILRRYDLADPVLWRIAAIVDEADIEERGLRRPRIAWLRPDPARALVADDDPQVVDFTAPIFDAVRDFLRRSLLTETDAP